MVRASLVICYSFLLRFSFCWSGATVSAETEQFLPVLSDLQQEYGPLVESDCVPRHMHIAQATNIQDEKVSMTVTFSLDYEKCKTSKPILFYGSDHGDRKHEDDMTVTDVLPLQFNYTSNKSHGLYQSDFIYHMEIPNLCAGLRQHWYKIVVVETDTSQLFEQYSAQHRALRGATSSVVDDDVYNNLSESAPIYFLTPPLPHSPTTLALAGDLGQSQDSMRTIMDIYRATFSVGGDDSDRDLIPPPVSQLLIVGDESYADSEPQRWTSWMELVEPLVRSTPLHVAVGNHEIECDNETNAIFVPYEHWFRNPNRIRQAEMEPITEEYRKSLWNESCSNPSEFQGVYNYGNSFYSYKHGLFYIVVLNSYTDSTLDSVQRTWLEAELSERFDRQETPWLLVAFHSPLYTTFRGHVDEVEALNMKASMEPLFLKYGVNLVVSGKGFILLLDRMSLVEILNNAFSDQLSVLST